MSFGQLFDPISIDDHYFLLASHAPPGKFWRKVFDKNDIFGKIFLGLAVEFYRYQVLERNLFTEVDIDQTNELLVDWEKSVGLPDKCFETNVNQEERRSQVYQKFSKFQGVQKKEDFVRVAAFFGFNISVTSGKTVGLFPLKFPILFFSGKKEAVHTLFFILLDDLSSDSTFPLPFPIPFSVGGATFLQCIFEALAPANVAVIITNIGDI